MNANLLQLIILPAGLIAILFALYLARDVLRRDTGTKEMEDVAATIFEGAVAFIRRQYSTIAILALFAAVISARSSRRSRRRTSRTPRLRGRAGIRTGVAFLVGAACSMASGIIGMYISVKANVRTAAAARRSLVEAVQVAMRGGAVSGFLVVALSLLGVYGIFVTFGGLGTGGRAVPDRRLRLRRQLRRALRPAGRRDLHEGRRRRLGPRRQGRGGHPRGRPA